MILSAVIFDLDGTVVSDEDEWGEAFKKVLKRLGVTVDSGYPHVGGIGIEENWPLFIKRYKIKTAKTIEELTAETLREFNKLIFSVDVKPGFEEFVMNLREGGVKTALATSSTWATVQNFFDRLKIEPYFDSVTTGEEVLYKKPDPEIFLKAAEKLGTDPESCLVIEDSGAGVEAAKNANMKVVGIARDEKHAVSLKKANLVVAAFPEITVKEIASL